MNLHVHSNQVLEDYKGPRTKSDGITLTDEALQDVKARISQMVNGTADKSQTKCRKTTAPLTELYKSNKNVMRAGFFFFTSVLLVFLANIALCDVWSSWKLLEYSISENNENR